MTRVLAAALLALSAGSARAVIALPDHAESMALGSELEWAVEPAGPLRFDEASAADSPLSFVRAKGDLNLGLVGRPVWVRMEIAAHSDALVLELAYTQIDYLDAYVRIDARTRAHSLGDRQSRVARAYAYRYPLVLLPADRAATLYLRAESAGSVQFPLTLWRQSAFHQHALLEHFLVGGYTAVLAAMTLYNLLLLLAVRHASYLYYVGYLGALLGFQLTFSGHAGVYLWQESTYWLSVAPLSLMAVCLSCGCLFVRSMTDVQPTSPLEARLLPALAMLCLAPAVVVHVDLRSAMYILVPAALAVLLYLPFPIVRAVRSGYSPANYLLIGLAVILPGGLLYVLRYLKLAPLNFWTLHGLKLSTAAEAILFSFALAARLSVLRDQRETEKALRLQAEARLARARLETRNAERQRIRDDLHDDLGAHLLTMVHSASNESQRHTAREALDHLSQVIDALDPEPRSLQALTEAWRCEAQRRLRTAGIELDWDSRVPADTPLGARHSVDLTRVIRELVSNAIKHSGAGRVGIRIEIDDNGEQLDFAYSDDGRGLPPAAPHASSGHGLQSLRRRLSALGAAHVVLGSGRSGGMYLSFSAKLGDAKST